MVTFSSPRASQRSGFHALDGGADEMTERDIPLTTVRSAASTGSRMPNQTINRLNSAYDASSSTTEEKSTGSILHKHAGKRKKVERLSRKGTGDSVEVNALGRLYRRVVSSSPVVRNLVYIIPIGIFIAIPIIILVHGGAKLNRDSQEDTKDGDSVAKDGPTALRILVWVEIWWLSLWVGKLAAWLLPKVFMFLCGIVSAGVRKYATVLKNLKIPLSLFFWGLASFISFDRIFTDALNIENNPVKGLYGPTPWVVAVDRVLKALFGCSGVLLAEKAWVQIIGVTYHQRSFANRIKDSKHEIRLLGLLYEASRTLFPMYCTEFAEEDYIIDDSIEMMLRKKSGHHKRTGSATPMKLIGDVSRLGGKVTSAFGNVASEIAGKQVFNPHSAHSIVIEALEKRLPSEALARRIWLSFVCEGRDALFVEDFYEVLGPEYTAEAEEAFGMIDADLNGDISLDEMVLKVVELGKERKAISEGMKDIGQALQAFDKVLLFIVLIVSIFIFLWAFQSDFLKTVATAGTALLSLSFVFATTTQEFLGSCIFLFVKHPYDVGDRVEINKTQMVVERISLLYSVFVRTDKMQTVQVPNIQLNNLWVDNVTRSRAMIECFEVNVSYDTSFEDIELLRVEMEKFVRAPENSRDFHPDFNIGVGSVNNLDKMTLEFVIKHKSNWHNDSIRATRRSKFMCALALALKKVPIYAPGGGTETLGGPTNPTYSVAVTDAFASQSREDAAKSKDSARMVPTAKEQTAKEHQQAEEHAVSELNTRPLHVETTLSAWDTRDSEPQNSPGDFAAEDDPLRSREIQQMRNDLHKKESQRGRRKAGDTISATPVDGRFPSKSGGPRLGTFDEEAQTEIPLSQHFRDQVSSPMVMTEEEQQQGRPSMSSVRRAVHWPTKTRSRSPHRQ
ncbi:hypothetical protein VHEMI00718 [[Torrubiella] hemipterigena]|uniref:Mechanosensitive ion channel protein n=1 Tax=[Torrubiella] hemipterigena TaxID=1531966 RepID=A0A0A1T359_9HYPO|nr:hypothetical protein VHEMI00718 [[Torrubiella] hemipterigena]